MCQGHAGSFFIRQVLMHRKTGHFSGQRLGGWACCFSTAAQAFPNQTRQVLSQGSKNLIYTLPFLLYSKEPHVLDSCLWAPTSGCSIFSLPAGSHPLMCEHHFQYFPHFYWFNVIMNLFCYDLSVKGLQARALGMNWDREKWQPFSSLCLLNVMLVRNPDLNPTSSSLTDHSASSPRTPDIRVLTRFIPVFSFCFWFFFK